MYDLNNNELVSINGGTNGPLTTTYLYLKYPLWQAGNMLQDAACKLYSWLNLLFYKTDK